MTKKMTTEPVAEVPAVKVTKGYKVTKQDMTCLNYQYEIGKRFKIDGPIEICETGFHFCEKVADCFNYYDFSPENRVFEILAFGELDSSDDKHCCGEIEFVRELTWEEMLAIANEGKGNTGLSNTGHSNTGHWNTGDSNTGDRNTGDSNTGDRNTGDRNTGDSNTGHSNTGHWNTGDRNTGDRNTGHWNTGDRNTGHSNTGDSNTGAFCTETPPFLLFDQPTAWTLQDFEKSDAFKLMMRDVDTKLWVPDHAMTDEEKAANKGWERAGGFYRDIPFKDAFTNAWHNWSERYRSAFTSLPNFNAEKFEQITGVKVDQPK
ncbi:MAG: DUF7666 domain-containing protein [Pseudobacter sp.]|uniref:DUF7666 domain-containing protein n=1 Tax=Pseudobacter sp. TaxID=2045420 RepID=UPI003F806C12